MNAKIPVKKLSDKVATSIDVPVDEVQSFIKLLFDAIADELNKGGSVTIPGLGDFMASSNPDEPVAFIPAAEFSDTINSPFAMFEPVPLNDGVTEDALNNAITTDEVKLTQNQEQNEDADLGNTVVTPVPVDHSGICDEGTALEEVPHTYVEQPHVASPEIMDMESEIVCINATDTNDNESVSYVSESEKIVESPADIDEQSALVSEIDDTSLYIPEDEEEYVNDEEPYKPRFFQGFIVGLITGLAIGALALFAYMVYFINTPVNIGE